MKPLTILYAGESCEQHECFLNDYPSFDGGGKVYNTYAVPGMDGELVEKTDYLGNLTITCIFSVTSKRVMDVVREIRRWLSGTGTLVISDSPDIFYRVLKIEYGEISREIRTFGTFEALFVCTPFEYLQEGQREIQSLTYNPYDMAKPIYRIVGEGLCTLTVNGYDFTANVGQSIIINTERQLAYNPDRESLNTSVTGDYTKLWLPNGNNQISISSGFQLWITPQWGYRI